MAKTSKKIKKGNNRKTNKIITWAKGNKVYTTVILLVLFYCVWQLVAILVQRYQFSVYDARLQQLVGDVSDEFTISTQASSKTCKRTSGFKFEKGDILCNISYTFVINDGFDINKLETVMGNKYKKSDSGRLYTEILKDSSCLSIIEQNNEGQEIEVSCQKSARLYYY